MLSTRKLRLMMCVLSGTIWSPKRPRNVKMKSCATEPLATTVMAARRLTEKRGAPVGERLSWRNAWTACSTGGLARLAGALGDGPRAGAAAGRRLNGLAQLPQRLRARLEPVADQLQGAVGGLADPVAAPGPGLHGLETALRGALGAVEHVAAGLLRPPGEFVGPACGPGPGLLGGGRLLVLHCRYS